MIALARGVIRVISLLALLCLLAFLPVSARAAHSLCYVDINAAGANDGTSWTNAYTDPQDALAHLSCTEIWVAAGTYTPDGATPGDRTLSFIMRSGLAVYGGFNGTETAREQRDWEANETILAGEIGTGTLADNSYHVVTTSGVDATFILDGFTIRDGFTVSSLTDRHGGGIYNEDGKPRLRNLRITNNRAVENGFGAGMYSAGPNHAPELTNVAFIENGVVSSVPVTSGGGGLYIGSGSATLTDVSFIDNFVDSTGDGGGGLRIEDANVVLTNVLFEDNFVDGAAAGALITGPGHVEFNNAIFRGNHSRYNGGAVATDGSVTVDFRNVTFENNRSSFENGGALLLQGASQVNITNATFSGNQAGGLSTPTSQGGAVYSEGTGNRTFNNVTFAGNQAQLTGGGVTQAGTGSLQIRNSVLWGNNPDQAFGAVAIVDSLVQGGCPVGATCTGVLLTTDPQLGALQDNGGFTHTMALPSTSPAVDAGGVNEACAAQDQRGIPRPQGAGCDMGAYELIVAATGPRCYVDADISWVGNGSSWATAYRDLQHALANTACTEIWVAEGTYKPDGSNPGDRNTIFTLKNGVEIYGGFVGTEALLSERDWRANDTILSGEIGSTDLLDNSIHVVTGSGTNSGAVLDGFTVTGGYNVTGGSEPNHSGAGIYNDAGSPTLRNLFITDNRAAFGGGMANRNASVPIITDVTFYANHASYGAGMSNRNGAAPQIHNTTFHANQAGASGAGMYNDTGATPVLSNVTFYANVSLSNGGGMYNNGAGPLINNATFYNNSAITGHSMENLFSSPLISNSIFWSTHASSEFFNTVSSPSIEDSIVKGGCPVDAVCNGLIIDADPLLGPLQDNGGFTHTLALAHTSPAIDVAGANVSCASDDQRGVIRPQHAGCDIGAYEYDGALPAPSSGTGPSGQNVANQPIAPSGLTRLDLGRITVSVPVTAIPPGQSNCVVSISQLGSSAEHGFVLDDTVWDVKVRCNDNEVSIFFDALTICIRPHDGVTSNKNVYHRHGAGSFQPLSGEGWAGYVCGQTRVLSLFTLGSLSLPATGFAPGVVSHLPEQSVDYAASDLRLSIPKLGVALDVVGVPQSPNGWDVAWLSSGQAGYLYGTSFPTWQGNSALTAHVWNADNTPGPFHALKELHHGDRFTITAYGSTYVYEVLTNQLVVPSSLSMLNSTAFGDYSAITLITCETFSAKTGGYLYRRAVQAVLVEVQ